MESQEPMSIIYCDDGTMKEDWPFNLWMKHLARASMVADRPLGIANKMKRWYEEAGYVDVEERVFKVPLNPWPKDPHMKLLGALEMENMLSGLQAFSLAYFTRDLQWTKDETEVWHYELDSPGFLRRDSGCLGIITNDRKRCISSMCASRSRTAMYTHTSKSTSSGAANRSTGNSTEMGTTAHDLHPTAETPR